ncbi:TPA: hypothetical protein ACS778_002935 [Providencia alcalifaciens]
MIYQTGTIATTAGQTKITGTGTRWKDNLAGISEGCPISYLINNVVHMNTVLSVNSDTEINLTYPVPVAASAAKYQIATFVLDSMSDGVRKMLANQQYIQYFLRNMDAWMTQDGIVEVKAPTGETVKLESIIALKKMIDGKMAVGANGLGASPSGNTQPVTYKDADKLEANGFYAASGGDSINFAQLYSAIFVMTRQGGSDNSGMVDQLQLGNGRIYGRSRTGMKWSNWMSPLYPGDSGIGLKGSPPLLASVEDFTNAGIGFYIASDSATSGLKPLLATGAFHGSVTVTRYNAGNSNCHALLIKNYGSDWLQIVRRGGAGSELESCLVWHSKNTTKDANGNLKAASPVVKLFADGIELNDESEGVEMEHLGVGHYLIKGVIGFNADGAWGINNGFVIPQDHNGKNMVLIDYEVRPDGDIEVFVFHQQNAEMPERFQNKRIKHFDEDGNPVYFENYEPCDVPESRWIDMRVEMPPNSIYNQKLAEAEQLAKIEAERVAKEKAEKAAREEAERLEEESKQEQASKLEE